MAKKKEEPVQETTRAERFMQARLRESERLAAEWEASRDPREVA